MSKIFSVFFIITLSFHSIAQTSIEGYVYDNTSRESLIGATVVVLNTNNGTVTDLDGRFSLQVNKLPVTILVNYLGYKKKSRLIDSEKNISIYLDADDQTLKEIKIIDSRLTKKQKESPLTVEALDVVAIKETPSVNFYDGLGALKGVDIMAASLGFKIINTRGFNSTSPVRSLQIIDGVDNQAPGLNFSLGNFLGASELDIMKVEIIQGASSAYYGPNAFNGVISMQTKSPFKKKGLSAQIKIGERNLLESMFRYAHVIKNRKQEDIFAFKINFSYLQANDWVANNMSPVQGTDMNENNPGGYDAVNRYGDEDTDGNLNDLRSDFNQNYFTHPGLGKFHRTGYLESDLVDYNTRNIKAATSFHYLINPDTELIYALNYGTGNTVYQGDNRYNLKGIQFLQNRLEINNKDKFFIRAYRSQEDAGKSYDAVFTAFRLQEYNQVLNEDWYRNYKNNWRDNFGWEDIGWENAEYNFLSQQWTFQGNPIDINNWIEMSDSALNANADDLIALHNFTREQTDNQTNRLVPGTSQFNDSLNSITSRIPINGGTGFYDNSALNHLHAEYKFTPSFADVKFGANIRRYLPDSKGSIFSDTAKLIQNTEYGFYCGIDSEIINNLKLSATIRVDKNENFKFNISPAASLVYKLTNTDILRLSFSSAIRNPTLSDQYLYYNVGRAILIGNLNGHGTDYGENLVTIPSLINYFKPAQLVKDSLKFFSIDPIQPEKAKSFEIGYRTTIMNKVYLDANYYYSRYNDFIGYRIGAKHNGQDTLINGVSGYYLPPTSIQVYRMAANSQNIVTTKGMSIGINYFINSNYSINGNYSWNKLNEKGTEDPIIPAYNTPENKFNIGFSGRDIHISRNSILRNYSFSLNYKWVQGYLYEGSPQFTGNIPSYGLVDMQISKEIPRLSAILKVGSSNILNNLHYEVYGGPYIGRMTYCSLLFELD